MDKCKTKYPIMLIHGIGFSDERKSKYWGRIPDIIEKNGGEVYFSGQSGFGSIIENANEIKNSILKVLESTGAEKINLIAHSKGGLEARYLISKLDMSSKVASLTTLATPHRGILALEKSKFKKPLSNLFSLILKLGGGEKSKEKEPYEQLSSEYMEIFNEYVKDADDVYYQSYAFDMKAAKTFRPMGLFYRIIKKYEGKNDGLVSVASTKWGDFRGVVTGVKNTGIAHPEVVDSGCKTSMPEFYINLIERLKSMGY